MTTPANQPDLFAWLRAQLDDDERVARRAGGIRDLEWTYDRETFHVISGRGQSIAARKPEGNPINDVDGVHIARHDPARVLAEVDAKRRIMAIHNRRADIYPGDAGGTFDNCCDGCGFEGPCEDPVTEDVNDCPILRALALPYADHEGFREEWRLT